MAIDGVGGVVVGLASPAAPRAVARLETPALPRLTPGEGGPRWVRQTPAPSLPVSRWIGRVAEAQARMDRILALAASGRTFSPAELLALQAGVAEASQTVDLAGKVLDRVTAGLKQVLQTQV
jgi:hypothetical protein